MTLWLLHKWARRSLTLKGKLKLYQSLLSLSKVERHLLSSLLQRSILRKTQHILLWKFLEGQNGLQKWQQLSLTSLRKMHSYSGDLRLHRWKRNQKIYKSVLLRKISRYGDSFGESLKDHSYYYKLLTLETLFSITLKTLRSTSLRLEITNNLFYFLTRRTS